MRDLHDRAARVVARFQAQITPDHRVATEFTTKKELDRYLKDHPDADRKNHSVKKQTKKPSKDGQRPAREEVEFTSVGDWNKLRSEAQTYHQKHTNDSVVTEFSGKNDDGSKWTVVMKRDLNKPAEKSKPSAKPKPTEKPRSKPHGDPYKRDIDSKRERVNDPKGHGLDPNNKDDAEDLAQWRDDIERYEEEEIDRRRENGS